MPSRGFPTRHFLLMKKIVLISLLILCLAAGELTGTAETFSALVLVVTALFASLYFFYYSIIQGNTLKLNLVSGILCFVAIVYCLSTWLSEPWYNSGYLCQRYLTALLLLIYLSQSQKELSIRDIQPIFAVVLYALAAIFALANIGGLVWGYSDFNTAGGLALTFGNRNYAAAILIISFHMVLPAAFFEPTRLRRIVYAFAALVACFLLLLAGSRNGLIQFSLSGVLLFALTLFLYRSRQDKQVRLIICMITVLVGVASLAFFLVPDDIVTKLLSIGRNASDSGRLAIWHAIVGWIFDSPLSMLFGHGAGYLYSHAFIFPTEGFNYLGIDGARYAHCEYLDIALEGGLFSVCLIALTFVYTLAFHVRRLSEESISYRDRFENIGLVCSVCAIVGFAFFSVATRYSNVILITVVLLAVAIVSMRYCKLSRKITILFNAVALCFLIFTTNSFLKKAIADHYYLRYSQVFNAWFDASSGNTDLSPIAQNVILREGYHDPDSSLLSNISARVIYYLQEGLRYDPEHIRLLTEEHKRLVELADIEMLNQCEEIFLRIESLVPNLSGSWLRQSEYYAHVGLLDKAIELATRASNTSYYNLSYQFDLFFYQSMLGDFDASKRSLIELIHKAALAEVIRGTGSVVASQVLGLKGVRVEYYLPDAPRELMIMQINADAFLSEAYDLPVLTQDALRQSVILGLKSIFVEHMKVKKPVFMSMFREVKTSE